MPIIFDKLSAAVVGAVVFLLLFGLQIRVQGGRIEDSLVYNAKQQTLAFADMVERDLANTGYLSVPGDDVIISHSSSTYDSTTVTSLFEFWGLGDTGIRSKIRYAAVQIDSAYVVDKMVPAFQIERYEDDGFGWNMTGASSAQITEFTIQLLDENNNVAIPSNARQIRVRIGNAVAVNPMSTSTEHKSTLAGREMKWGITIAPRGLSLQGYQG
ncbi:MAG: hypothetical protein HKN13_07395 [Rhodothermales bacterium]|nr:hypothetical protein [Rhodothermales bacterium]